MQRSDREDGLDRWGECVDRTCVGRRWGECVDGEPVPENSPWVCVWLSDRSGWTGDRLAELDRVRWSGSVWVWALTHHGSAAFGTVIVWLSLAWPVWGRSVSVARSELSFFLSLSLCCCAFWALSAFFLSLSQCIAWPGNELKWKWECKFISGLKV